MNTVQAVPDSKPESDHDAKRGHNTLSADLAQQRNQREAIRQRQQQVDLAAAPLLPSETLGTARPQQWKHGLFGCFGDFRSCCTTVFCAPCVAGQIAEHARTGAPPNSFCGDSKICCVSSVPLFASPLLPAELSVSVGNLVAYYTSSGRAALRSRYNLPAAPCNDFLVHLCCLGCALAQEKSEMEYRLRSGGKRDEEDALEMLR
eukprot:c6884_g1_i2.p1 GENE.c6884_g1_i2~~c6884_g1_i2.p1  ORF type:complete len:204 (-),score=5.29 c6884_g1_i2:71-682(-)